MVVFQTKQSWWVKTDKLDFMFIINRDKSSNRCEVWWWDKPTWKTNTLEQTRVLEI